MALQTLQEHNQEAHMLFVDLVKAYNTVNCPREIWNTAADDQSPKKLYTKVTYHMNVARKKNSSESTCGVKQGDNLGPILFIFMIQAVSMTLDKKWNFKTPDF
jgi:hypothetical protein